MNGIFAIESKQVVLDNRVYDIGEIKIVGNQGYALATYRQYGMVRELKNTQVQQQLYKRLRG